MVHIVATDLKLVKVRDSKDLTCNCVHLFGSKGTYSEINDLFEQM